MKNLLFIILTLIIFSCNPQVELNGKYQIVDFRMTQEFLKDTTGRNQLISLLDASDYKFDFSPENSTVTMEPKFGMRYFGDTLFKYTIQPKFIALNGPNSKINLEYKNDNGIIRLLVKKEDIELFSIIPAKLKSE